MQQQLLEHRGTVDIESLFTQSLRFTEFVEKTAPKTTNTTLPQLAQSLVQRLSFNSSADENGNFAVIRGGSMRSFLLNNYVTDERFAGLFDNVNPQLLGENPLAKRVIEKVFSLPKDIDIFFRVGIPHHQFHQDNILFSTIIEHLEQSGFTGLFRNGDKNEIALSDGKYQIRLFRHQTGINHLQTLVKIDISEGDQVVLKLHFGLIPDEAERQEDPRFFDDSADIDQEAVGYLTHDDNTVLMRYFGLGAESYVSKYLHKHFFDPLTKPFDVDPAKKPDQFLAARLREINFRVSLVSWLFRVCGITGLTADFQDTPYYALFLKYGMKYRTDVFGEEQQKRMHQWYRDNQDNIKDHSKLLASDAVYGLTVNPYLYFLFAFPTYVTDAFPLGERLDFMPMMNFLQTLALKSGNSIMEDSLLTLSLRYYIRLRKPSDTAIFQMLKFLNEPQTVSSYLKLITI